MPKVFCKIAECLKMVQNVSFLVGTMYIHITTKEASYFWHLNSFIDELQIPKSSDSYMRHFWTFLRYYEVAA